MARDYHCDRSTINRNLRRALREGLISADELDLRS
jgi:hypothetical protein